MFFSIRRLINGLTQPVTTLMAIMLEHPFFVIVQGSTMKNNVTLEKYIHL